MAGLEPSPVIIGLTVSVQKCTGYTNNDDCIESVGGADVVISPIRFEAAKDGDQHVIMVGWACSHGEKCWSQPCRYAKAGKENRNRR